MKRRLIALTLFPVMLLSLVSCNDEDTGFTQILSQVIPSCSSDEAQADLVCTTKSTFVVPFESGITLRLYGKDKNNQEIIDAFVADMKYYGALFDRHHDYQYRHKLNAEYENMINVKYINDTIAALNASSKTATSIILSPELFSGLRTAVDFSLASSIGEDLRYNLSVGRISALYDTYISQAQEIGYQDSIINKMPDLVSLRDDNSVVVHPDFDADEFAKAHRATLGKSELESMFGFVDSTNTLTINKIKTYETGYTPAITLGGYGKGYAEKIFSAAYPDAALLLNGGSSSIMTQNVKTGGQKWSIKIDNPIYREEMAYLNATNVFVIPDLSMNESDFYFESAEGFTLSTSGYYNNYFYSLGEDGNTVLYHHIIDGMTGKSANFFDSVSVMITDPGYADMYSTALMNCTSLEEAERLRKQLDAKYNFTTWAVYTTHDKLAFAKAKIKAYIPESRRDMFHLMTAADVGELKPITTELIYF